MGQVANSICNYEARDIMRSLVFGIPESGEVRWNDDNACKCAITLNPTNFTGANTEATLNVTFRLQDLAEEYDELPERDDDEDGSNCSPILFIGEDQALGNSKKGIYVCAAKTKHDTAVHVNTLPLRRSETIQFHLQNSYRENIIQEIKLEGNTPAYTVVL